MVNIKRNTSIFIFVASLWVVFSCVPKGKLNYLHDQNKDEIVNEYMNIRPEKTIQPFDNIYIKVSSIDERTANIFADQNRAISGPNIDLISYTVDQSGYVNFPFVGEIYIKDLTLDEAQKRIEQEVSQYLSNISITVKFVNNMVAVLGEVRRPGEYPFFRDQITIFQALSYANGIGDYGNKENIILIREANNQINYHYLDLTNKNIVSSPYYYIIPNDVLIVRPINAKYRNLSMVNWPIFLTTITTAVTLYLLFVPRNN